ncbi:hypothetical protein CRE_06670 [Caenorhabditis remanei]|uniref:Receptor expression-enhancing protein n=1 Tax=Caenorhabditis remanei TaxID=31234 RepID=E3M0U4_CAERE|nr:hypothetical protein CRE_06670 [Caenorhabditis remanei]
MSFLARGLSNLIGIVAPVIHSFKVLKKPTRPKLIQCLHFWTIYGSFLICDWFLNTFFISCFIPFYDFFVLSFITLLSVPHLGFASVLYTKFLAPFLRKNERRIDGITMAVMLRLWECMPAVAMTVPAVMASIVNAFNTPMADIPQLEVEEMEDSLIEIHSQSRPSVSSRRVSSRIVQRVQPALDLSFEIQDESENDENDGGDVFREFPVRQVKQEEILDEEERVDHAPSSLRRRPAPTIAMRTRRQLRSQSAQ